MNRSDDAAPAHVVLFPALSLLFSFLASVVLFFAEVHGRASESTRWGFMIIDHLLRDWPEALRVSSEDIYP